MLIGLVLVLALAFGLTALMGAPWLPTHRRQVAIALDMLELDPEETVIDLGSGTGMFLRQAARRDLNAIGYELNPLLCVVAWLVTFKYRHRVKIRCRDYWRVTLPEAQGVYVFLIGRYMKKLDDKLKLELAPGTPVVSYAFKMPGVEPERELEGLNLYRY